MKVITGGHPSRPPGKEQSKCTERTIPGQTRIFDAEAGKDEELAQKFVYGLGVKTEAAGADKHRKSPVAAILPEPYQH